MKQNEIALIIFIVVISLFFSYFIGNTIFKPAEGRSAEVEIVNLIDTEFPIPDKQVFNAKAINPTETIKIGNSNTDNPFSEE